MAQVHCPPPSHYQISRQPPFPKKTIQHLEWHHGAVYFLEALRAFINTLPCGCQYLEPNINDHFDVFSNVVLIIPPIEHAADVISRIHSHPECSNGVCKPPTLARFDTVLVDVNTELQQQQGRLYGMLASKSLCYYHLLIIAYRSTHGRSPCHLQTTIAPWQLPPSPHLHPLVQAP